jgi:hypothetical protein
LRQKSGAKSNFSSITRPKPVGPTNHLAIPPVLPVRPHVNPSAAGSALHPALEPRHQRVAWILRHVDQRLVTARVVEAEGDQVTHTSLVHVAERHRWAGWAVRVSSALEEMDVARVAL